MAENDLIVEAKSEKANVNLSIDVHKVPNPVLQRLIDEIRQEKTNRVGAYNRTHNRHNRGR